MAMSGSTPTLRYSCCGTRLWVKLHTSAELKPIRIVVPTVLGELRCGHITSVYCEMGWRELFWKCVRQLCRVLRRLRSPVAVLKLGSCVDQPFMLLGTRKTGFGNVFFQMNPCIKISFPQIKP